MKTRVGKIARLPAPIREQLNQRLFDGVLGKELTSWLNTLPEVHRVMAEQFAGIPISENNLSKWRLGGYRDWLNQRETRTAALKFIQKGLRMNPEDRLRYIETSIIAEFGNVLHALRDIPDPDIRMRRLQDLSREFVRMQKLHTAGRLIQLQKTFHYSTRLPNPANSLSSAST